MFRIARVLKSHGTDGELVIGFQGVDPEDIQTTEPVFLYFEGLPVPFFIESLQRRGTGKAIVRLTGIRSLEDAEEAVGKEVFLPEERRGDFAGDEEDLSVLEGWTLCDPPGRTLGVISGIEDIPGNPCIYVRCAGKEVLVPLHEDFIRETDPEHKRLVMELPDGLITPA